MVRATSDLIEYVRDFVECDGVIVLRKFCAAFQTPVSAEVIASESSPRLIIGDSLASRSSAREGLRFPDFVVFLVGIFGETQSSLLKRQGANMPHIYYPGNDCQPCITDCRVGFLERKVAELSVALVLFVNLKVAVNDGATSVSHGDVPDHLMNAFLRNHLNGVRLDLIRFFAAYARGDGTYLIEEWHFHISEVELTKSGMRASRFFGLAYFTKTRVRIRPTRQVVAGGDFVVELDGARRLGREDEDLKATLLALLQGETHE
jgi:hypothetical protein